MNITSNIITFVYPNSDEVECSAAIGLSILDVAINNGITMDAKVKKTCIIQIQSRSAKAESFHEISIHQPTEEEVKDFTEAQIESGYRYAHTYIVNESLNRAYIFLKLVRVYYTNKSNTENLIHAFEGENMTNLRHREIGIINDLSFACGGNLACSTCHCIIEGSNAEFKATGAVSEEEEDLLSWVNPTDHSRLGCQIVFKDKLDPIHIRHPKAKASV